MTDRLQPKDTALLVRIKHSKPIEVHDFVATMDAIGGLFDDYCKANGDSSEMRRAKLYVNKVEHGSIEIYLTEAITMLALPFIENMNPILEFACHIKTVIEYFTQGKGEKPKLSKNEMRRYSDIFAVTAGDNNGTTEIGAINIYNNPIFIENVTFTYSESNSAQNQLRKDIELAKEPVHGGVVYEQQVMKIFQMRSNMDSDSGNKAIIDALCDKPLHLMFASEDLKRIILHSDYNPAKQLYVVDVMITTAYGRPIAYSVVALREVFDDDY
jgi:hypothetical protein